MQAPEPVRVCIDRKRVRSTSSVERLAALRSALWSRGTTLLIGFLDGDPEVHKRVEQVAQEWTKYANLTFRFIDSPASAQLRISFTSGGSWSYVGTEARAIPAHEPTMNLGWLTPGTEPEEYSRVVLHEFGHALGCIHEHQNPAKGIRWNEPAVFAHYSGWPNYWSEETTRHNLLETYDKTLTVHSEFDPESIMLYPVPAAHTLDGFSTEWNRKLSAKDIDMIRTLYPGRPMR